MDTKLTCHIASCVRHRQAPRSPLPAPRFGFTLVELLVVITIIGILAALIVTAAVGALGRAQEVRIKAEVNQLDTAFMEYKNKVTAFPPNCQTDGASEPIDETAVLNDLKRHLSQVAPRHQESENLLRVIAGLQAVGTDSDRYLKVLAGGMSAGEAIVFWLGGFSSDPKYPISGEGGPSYSIANISAPDRYKADPIETRNWVFPFEVTRLVPRADDNFFDETDDRFIEFTDPKGVARRINFWQYTPAKSEQPYLYFDTSRHPAYDATAGVEESRFDPPAGTDAGIPLHVHAFKKASESTSPNTPLIQFINPDKFQIIHCGRDGEWDVDAFERMSVHAMEDNWDKYLLFPNGPFTGEFADTIVNFTEQTKIEDAQP